MFLCGQCKFGFSQFILCKHLDIWILCGKCRRIGMSSVKHNFSYSSNVVGRIQPKSSAKTWAVVMAAQPQSPLLTWGGGAFCRGGGSGWGGELRHGLENEICIVQRKKRPSVGLATAGATIGNAYCRFGALLTHQVTTFRGFNPTPVFGKTGRTSPSDRKLLTPPGCFRCFTLVAQCGRPMRGGGADLQIASPSPPPQRQYGR